MENEPDNYDAPKSDPGFAVALAFALVSAIATVYGLAVACGWTSVSAVVGGDAYNFIIAGIRGIAWIGAGIVAAFFTVLSFLLSRP